MVKKRCECPDEGFVPPNREHLYSENEKIGMNHKPNECKCTNDLKLYNRDNKKLWLCSCCVLSGDIEIK